MSRIFYQPNEWSMVVMNGRVPVAQAQRKYTGAWQICIRNILDPQVIATKSSRDGVAGEIKNFSLRQPHLFSVETYDEARAIMTEIAKTGINKNLLNILPQKCAA